MIIYTFALEDSGVNISYLTCINLPSETCEITRRILHVTLRANDRSFKKLIQGVGELTSDNYNNEKSLALPGRTSLKQVLSTTTNTIPSPPSLNIH